MENCLLIGNGLNRCLEGSISWDSLLQEVAETLGVTHNKYIAMPLEYERIINSYLESHISKTDSIYLETKTRIANKLSNILLPGKSIHQQLPSININTILTTNYDFLLEYTYNRSYKDAGTQQKYLPDATSTQGKVCFYHPHGIASRKLSLCLGYEHYMGIVEKMRTNLNRKENNEKEKMLIKQRLYNELPFENTWYEKFYTSNIAIVGLGLTECEVDLWWLLTHRAFLYYSNYCGLQKKIVNYIVYYDIIDDMKKNDADQENRREGNLSSQYNRHMLLSNEHVIVRKYHLSHYDGSYAEAYSSILDDLRRNGFQNNEI